MKKPFFRVSIAILALCAMAAAGVQAQPARTGTNLNSKAMPSEVLRLQEPDEVERIRKLLLDGRKSDALAAAESYIDKVERNSLRHESVPKYYAWNAYCTVLTSVNRVDDAITACSTAMAYEPGKWSAVNNRGTAKFVGGRLQEALADYRAALELVDAKNTSALETIEHNIALIEDRL